MSVNERIDQTKEKLQLLRYEAIDLEQVLLLLLSLETKKQDLNRF
jgi:hypothetical protein